MTRPITAGVDGSLESHAALAWAAREAVRRNRALHVVHVWQQVPDQAFGAASRETHDQWVRDGVDETARTVAEHHPELTVTVDVVEGGPAHSLAEAAADAEMLVLGSRGHGAVVGFLLGSVGQHVIAESVRPVVLVRAEDRASDEAAGREVVVGQHGDPEESGAALGFAFEAAAARGAAVRAVRAWSLPPLFAYSPGSMKLLDDAGGMEPYEKDALTAALEPWRARFPEVPVTQHVEMGSAGEVLLSVAPRAQLLVVGRRAHRSALGARIGSVTHGVLHHAHCPVAVVPYE